VPTSFGLEKKAEYEVFTKQDYKNAEKLAVLVKQANELIQREIELEATKTRISNCLEKLAILYPVTHMVGKAVGKGITSGVKSIKVSGGKLKTLTGVGALDLGMGLTYKPNFDTDTGRLFK
jgi:hypothetical protein